MNKTNVARLLQERQNMFIETRTIIENEVNKFLESLSKLDNSTKAKCGVQDVKITARDLLPALWAEPFDENAYNSQLSSLNKYISEVELICEQLNKEALRCLQS